MRATTDRRVMSTYGPPTLPGVIVVVLFLVEPVLDRFVRDRKREVGVRRDVFADCRKAVVCSLVRVGRAMFVDATISPVLGQFS